MHIRLRIAAALLVLLVLPVAAPQPAPTTPALRIVELLPAPDSATGQREFIELLNPGDATIDLDGWRIEDAPTASGAVNGFTFDAQALPPGARLVVWSNGSGDARGPSWSSSPSKTVWNDAGDAAFLLDPSGNIVDWVPYGNNAAAPPPGFDNLTRPTAPTRGLALALQDGNWTEEAPTPALAPGVQGGVAAVEVQNVAPDASLSTPTSAKPGETVRLTLTATDGNGPADLASWTVRAGGLLAASGNGTPPASLDLRAPLASGPWPLDLEATDRAGAAARSNATVQVRDARVAVNVPASGGLRFPPLTPGQRNVTSLEPFILHNDGTDVAPLLLDVSPFSGTASIAVDGNLWIGLAAGNATPQWIRYEHPLQALPPLAPGESRSVWLRLDQVPSPLPAGSYGTSFAVVTA